MLRENWTMFSITVNKYILPFQPNFAVRLWAVLHFDSQNLESLDHSISEIERFFKIITQMHKWLK